MSSSQVEAPASRRDLLSAAEKLPDGEFDEFVTDILRLRAQRVAPCLTRPETELLDTIHQRLPTEVQRRFDELRAKCRDEALTAEEHAELLRLTDAIEKQDAIRVQALADLARLRHMTVDALMQQLGIRAPSHE